MIAYYKSTDEMQRRLCWAFGHYLDNWQDDNGVWHDTCSRCGKLLTQEDRRGLNFWFRVFPKLEVIEDVGHVGWIFLIDIWFQCLKDIIAYLRYR